MYFAKKASSLGVGVAAHTIEAAVTIAVAMLNIVKISMLRSGNDPRNCHTVRGTLVYYAEDSPTEHRSA